MEMVPAVILGESVIMPDFRAERDWDTWEHERLESIEYHLRPGDVIYDVGAEEGDMSALYAKWGAEVVLIEPNERVWPIIKAIWDANDLPEPAGFFPGFIDDITFTGDQSLVTEWPASISGEIMKAHGFYHIWEQPDYPKISIDELSTIVSPPNAITIDVEGSELLVLRSASETLRDDRPLVWVSVHTPEVMEPYGYGPQDVHQFMLDMSYNGEMIAHDHEQHWLYTPKESR